MKRKTQIAIKRNLPSITVGAVCLVAVMFILFFPHSNNPTKLNLSEYSSVNTICELATLKSFYHNVAMYEEKPDGGNKIINDIVFWPFGAYTKVGYKQFWLEYSGIVETGIDASQIKINGPDDQGVVEIFVPDAKVLSVYADENSLTEPLSEYGWFTSISGKEKTEAFSSAQTAMRQEAEKDASLLKRAKENAKVLLERYVINTGKEVGLKLSVKWSEPAETP